VSITTPTEAYCTLADVGNLLPHRTYSTTSKPTTLQAEATIKDVARFIDGALRSLGYSAPLSDADDVQTLKLINQEGAAALIETATLGGTQGESPVVATYSSAFESHMDDIRKGKFKFKGAGSPPGGDPEGQEINYESGDEPDPVFENSEDSRKTQF
jgi:hypothetical protein